MRPATEMRDSRTVFSVNSRWFLPSRYCCRTRRPGRGGIRDIAHLLEWPAGHGARPEEERKGAAQSPGGSGRGGRRPGNYEDLDDGARHHGEAARLTMGHIATGRHPPHLLLRRGLVGASELPCHVKRTSGTPTRFYIFFMPPRRRGQSAVVGGRRAAAVCLPRP